MDFDDYIETHCFNIPPSRRLFGLRVVLRGGAKAVPGHIRAVVCDGYSLPRVVLDEDFQGVPVGTDHSFAAQGAGRVEVTLPAAYDVEPMEVSSRSGVPDECPIGRAVLKAPLAAVRALAERYPRAAYPNEVVRGRFDGMGQWSPPPATTFARIRWAADRAFPIFRDATRRYVEASATNVDEPMTDRMKAEILLAAARERAIAEPSRDETFLAPSWQDTYQRRLLAADEMAALLIAAFAAVGLEARPVGLIPPGSAHPVNVAVEVKIDGAWTLADGMRDLPLGAPEIVPEGYDVCRPRGS